MSSTVDLRTRWLGLELRNPIVASASPLTGNVDSLKRLRDREYPASSGCRGRAQPPGQRAAMQSISTSELPGTPP